MFWNYEVHKRTLHTYIIMNMFYLISITQLEKFLCTRLKCYTNTSNTISSPSSKVVQFKPSLLNINWFHRMVYKRSLAAFSVLGEIARVRLHRPETPAEKKKFRRASNQSYFPARHFRSQFPTLVIT